MIEELKMDKVNSVKSYNSDLMKNQSLADEILSKTKREKIQIINEYIKINENKEEEIRKLKKDKTKIMNENIKIKDDIKKINETNADIMIKKIASETRTESYSDKIKTKKSKIICSYCDQTFNNLCDLNTHTAFICVYTM